MALFRQSAQDVRMAQFSALAAVFAVAAALVAAHHPQGLWAVLLFVLAITSALILLFCVGSMLGSRRKRSRR